MTGQQRDGVAGSAESVKCLEKECIATSHPRPEGYVGCGLSWRRLNWIQRQIVDTTDRYRVQGVLIEQNPRVQKERRYRSAGVQAGRRLGSDVNRIAVPIENAPVEIVGHIARVHCFVELDEDAVESSRDHAYHT